MAIRLAVLASGRGSNLQAILDAIASFSPSPAIRAALGKEMRALMTSTERVHERLATAISEEELTTAIETSYEAALRGTRNEPGSTAGDGGSSASAAPPSSA